MEIALSHNSSGQMIRVCMWDEQICRVHIHHLWIYIENKRREYFSLLALLHEWDNIAYWYMGVGMHQCPGFLTQMDEFALWDCWFLGMDWGDHHWVFSARM